MRWLLRFLFGWYRVTCPRSETEKVLNLLLEKRIVSWGYSAADSDFSFSVGRAGARMLKEQFSDVSCARHGSPVLLEAFLRRPGILVGGVLALLIFFLGTTVVWDVRIEGNRRLSDSAARRMLSDAGLSVGMRLSDVNREQIVLRVLENESAVSHLALNLRGGVAYVKLMESSAPPSGDEKKGGANLVASCDALIDSLAVRRGEVCVRAGQVVRKGELLVSGVTDAAHLLYAEGEVFGRISESFTVTVPLKSEVAVRKEEKNIGFSLIFFGKTINIFGGGGNLPPTCGTIYNWERCMLPGNIALPLSYARVTVPITEYEEAPLDRRTAISYAIRLANERLQRELGDGELLARTFDGVFTEDSYILTCEYVCVRNIAKTEEFEIS